MTISAIKTNNDRLYWCGMFRDWHERHKEYLNARTTSKVSDSEWYTHKMVRKAYIHLRRALPDMFRFIENPRIPKTTNALESFSDISKKIYQFTEVFLSDTIRTI